MITNNFISHEGMKWGAARVLLDLPYKNANNHINAAFYKPTGTFTNSLSPTFSNRVQNFALGILLLIPLINIVVELALRIFSTNQQAPLTPPIDRSVNQSVTASPKTSQRIQPTLRTSVNDDRVMRCLSTKTSMEVTSISSQINQKTSEPPRAIDTPVLHETPGTIDTPVQGGIPPYAENSSTKIFSPYKDTHPPRIFPATSDNLLVSNNLLVSKDLLELERKRKIEQEIAEEEEWEEEQEARRKSEEEQMLWTIIISQEIAMDQK